MASEYGAFSVSVSQVDRIVRYIENQEAHHRKMSFQEEFIALLKKHRIEYDESYLWEKFNRPFGTCASRVQNPAVNCRAIVHVSLREKPEAKCPNSRLSASRWQKRARLQVKATAKC